MSKNNNLCCPSCGWHPDGGAHWQCLCGNKWDVFSTGGRCPACFRQWEKTQCVPRLGGCSNSSPHLEWYGDLNGWLKSELSFAETKSPIRKKK